MSSNLRARLEKMRNTGEIATKSASPKKNHPDNNFLFPGEEYVHSSQAGSCYYREKTLPLHSFHGNGRLDGLLACAGKDLVLPAKDHSLTAACPENALFLDLETTGLSGGTGTWIILIGLGWRRGDTFCIRQYFLTNPAEEGAMLRHFRETAENFSSFVTFNGKTFDLPMIHTRQVLSGLEKLQPAHHVDLLACSRRLWRERLTACGLRVLEKKLLGLQRTADIPGEEIPAVYFEYLRCGNTARLRDIFEHNVLDILSMVRLLVLVADAGAGRTVCHPADYYALGKLNAECGCLTEAAGYYEKAAACGNSRLEQTATLRLSMLLRRDGKWQQAAALWHELVNKKTTDLTPYLELAKYYEHRARNYQAALKLTDYVLTYTHTIPRFQAGQFNRQALLLRRERLQKKILHNAQKSLSTTQMQLSL